MKLELSMQEWKRLLPALSRLEERIDNLEKENKLDCRDAYQLRNEISRILAEQRYSLNDLPPVI